MDGNLGSQAAAAVDEKIREFQNLQGESGELRSTLGTLMAQRNENEMVKQVRHFGELQFAWEDGGLPAQRVFRSSMLPCTETAGGHLHFPANGFRGPCDRSERRFVASS